MSWNIAILTGICGFCCGILFMLIPAVTDRAKHLLHIQGPQHGHYDVQVAPVPRAAPVVQSRAMHPTVEDIMAMRRMLRQRGVVVRERR